MNAHNERNMWSPLSNMYLFHTFVFHLLLIKTFPYCFVCVCVAVFVMLFASSATTAFAFLMWFSRTTHTDSSAPNKCKCDTNEIYCWREMLKANGNRNEKPQTYDDSIQTQTWARARTLTKNKLFTVDFFLLSNNSVCSGREKKTTM